MKKIITGFFILASLFLFKFASAEITIPTLSSLSATSTGSTTAILSAFIPSSGGSTITEYGFCYSTTGASSRTCYKSSSVLSETRGGFSLNITGLVPNTSYAYYAYAKNSAGTGTIGEYIFKAPVVAGGTIPGVVISPASSITSSSVVFGGNVTYLGNPASISSRGVCYSSNSSYMPSYPGGSYGVVCVSDSGVSLGSYSISVTGLNPNTTYYYKAYAVNGTGVAYSGLSTFKTLANVVVSNSIPSIISSSVIKNSSSSTSLVMDVKSLGIPATVTSRGICYSTNSSYMPSYPGGYYSVNCIEDNSSNINLVNGFTINLATNPGATYYIKGYAKNSTGVAYTGLITFTIPESVSSNSIPTIVASPAGSVSQTGATLVGYVSNLGYPSVITSYGFCYNTNSSSLGYYPNANGSSTYGGSKCISFSDKIDSTESFRADITGLNPNTTYYYKAYAVNSTGTATSTNIQSFITETSVSTGGVDLVGFITNPSLPKTITKGTSLSFDGYIQNSGEVSVPSSSYVDYIIYIRNSNNTGVGSGTLYGTVTSGIKAGGSGSFYKNQSRVFDYIGTYNVSLCVDDGGINPRIPETNEQNNCKDVGVITVIDTSTSVSSTSSRVNLKPIMGYTTGGVKAGGSNGLRLAIINNGYEATKADTFYSYITVADQTKGAGNKVEIPLSYSKSVPVYKTNSDIVELIAQYTFDKAGTYSFAGCVDQKSSTDTSGLISESNEKDNCSPFMDVKILPNSSIYPDLSTGATAVPSGFTTPGTTLNFESLIFNNNLSKPTSGEFYNHFEIIDSTTGAIIKTLTPVKNSVSVGVDPIKLVGSYKFDNVGSYKVRTCADKKTYTDTGSIKEYNENNNCVGVSNPIVVSGTSSDKTTDSNTLLPDLISSMSPLVGVKAGTPVRLDAKVTNKGLVDIISQTGGHFEIKDSSGVITDVRYNYGSSGYIPKNSKASVTDSVVSYTFTTGGSYQVQFCADQIPTTHVGTIKESDEDNNCSGFINVVVADSSLPNLTVAFDNTTYIPGVQGTINATVTKTGNVAPNTTFYNRMDISTKSNLIQAWFSDFKSYKLTTNTNNFSGDTMKVSFPWKFVEGYTGVRFCTDQGNHSNNDGLNKVNQIKESSETDNCTDWVKFTPVTSGGTSALPDFKGSSIDPTATSVKQGSKVSFIGYFSNVGPVPTPSTTRYSHFEVSTTESLAGWQADFSKGSNKVVHASKSMSYLYSGSYTFNKAGDYYVRACEDQKVHDASNGVNQIKELDETNNCTPWVKINVYCSSCTPGGDSLPDLIIDGRIYTDNLYSVVKGVEFPLYATVKNKGGSTTTSFKNHFEFKDTWLGSVTDSNPIIINGLTSGGTTEIKTFKKFSKAGTYYVRVCADQEKRSDDGEVNDVKELSEKNNCYKEGVYDWTYIVVRDNYTDPINTTNGAYYGPLNGKNNKPIVNLTAYLPEYSSSLVSGSKVSYPGYIYNEGSAVTTDFKTSFSVTDSSGKIIANFPEIAFTPTIPANSKTAKSAYNFTLPTTPGTYTVKFCVDTTDVVTESTNADNCTTRTFVIGNVVGSSQLASCQAFKFTRNMSWGSTDLLDGNNEVEKLQKLLVWMKSKYPKDQWLSKISFTGSDGSFGKLTEEGVDYFQSFNPTLYGISNSAAVSLSQQTGNTDTKTRAKLNYFWQLYCADKDKSLTPSSGTWDLSVDSIILPEVVKINGSTPIIVRVRNSGTADIPPMSFHTNWRGYNNSDFITGNSLNTETVKAGSTIDVLTYHSFGNTGKQKVKACADIAYTNYGQYGNNTAIDKELSYLVNETNENNNCTPKWKNFTVVLK